MSLAFGMAGLCGFYIQRPTQESHFFGHATVAVAGQMLWSTL